jgi:hypothetical protein
LGKGVSTGFDDLLGLNQIRRNLDVEKPKLTGLRMVGAYKASSGLAIEFLENNLRITGCGKLIVDGRQYDVQRSGNQLQIRIQNTPQPILTGLGPGGKISAPAAAEITGSIITGYTNTWVEKRYTSDNSVVPGSGHWEQTPIFATKTERCAIGTLLPGPPAPVVGDHDGMLALFADAFSALAGDPSATKNLIAPGPRMAGVYTGSGGLKVEFRPEGAILDCQDAHAAVPYVVSNGASGVAVVVKNGGSPMTLTQQPDGALAGNGSIDVHGRLVTGSGANGITFRPVAATCAVGTLAAK